MARKSGARFKASEEAWWRFRAECSHRGMSEEAVLGTASEPGRIAEVWRVLPGRSSEEASRLRGRRFARSLAIRDIAGSLATERTAREWVDNGPSKEGAVGVMGLYASIVRERMGDRGREMDGEEAYRWAFSRFVGTRDGDLYETLLGLQALAAVASLSVVQKSSLLALLPNGPKPAEDRRGEYAQAMSILDMLEGELSKARAVLRHMEDHG